MEKRGSIQQEIAFGGRDLKTPLDRSGGGRKGGETLNQLAAKPNPTPLRAAAIEALCLIETESAAKHAATLFANVQGATLNPTPVLNAFLSREGASAALTNAFGATKLEAAFARHVLRSLYATGRNDEKLIAVLKKSAGMTRQQQLDLI
jgi:hypothetical protein